MLTNLKHAISRDRKYILNVENFTVTPPKDGRFGRSTKDGRYLRKFFRKEFRPNGVRFF